MPGRTPLCQTHNLPRILARSPAVSRAYAQARDELAGATITPREQEQIALAVAEINDSEYCLVAHTLAGRAAGMSDEDIRLARQAAAIDPRPRAMLRFTQAVVLQRGQIAGEELRALRDAGFSEIEIIEVIAHIAVNIFTNYLALAFKTEADIPPLYQDVKDSDARANSREARCQSP